MNPIITNCPVCGKEMSVRKLHCSSCDTTVEGVFQLGPMPTASGFTNEQLRWLRPFARLTPEQLQFVLTFVRCDGRFNRMEDELHLSYPTLRGRMDEILREMGYEPARDDSQAPPQAQLSPEERKRILDDLDRGVITLAEARRRLKGIREANPDDGNKE